MKHKLPGKQRWPWAPKTKARKAYWPDAPVGVGVAVGAVAGTGVALDAAAPAAGSDESEALLVSAGKEPVATGVPDALLESAGVVAGVCVML